MVEVNQWWLVAQRNGDHDDLEAVRKKFPTRVFWRVTNRGGGRREEGEEKKRGTKIKKSRQRQRQRQRQGDCSFQL